MKKSLFSRKTRNAGFTRTPDRDEELRSAPKAPSSRLVSGFSLIEVVVSIGVFVILAGAAYQTASSVFKVTQQNREGASISALADQYLEIARNLPYSDVGTYYGIPHGVLADGDHPISTTYNGSPYSIYYEVTYVDDPADGTAPLGTDPAPNDADYKQVKLSITNTKISKTYYFLTNIVPKGLENLGSGGALSISVIDADGDPVPGASISIDSVGITPAIHLDRTSDSTGKWIEVGVPVGTNAYHISVTKSGYSTDATYPITGGNPNPTKPDSTILNGQITSVNFSIDLTSTLIFNAENTLCAPLGSVGLEVRGAKLVGGTTSVSPVYKFDDSSHTTDGSGNTTFSNIEWDTYTPAVIGSTYMIYGSSPIQQINLLPSTSQLFTLILGAWTANSFLVIVKDATTGNPIENATVELSKSGYDSILYTGGSLLSQASWSGTSGQDLFTDVTRYFADDGNIDHASGVKLKSSGSPAHAIVPSGNLTSSTFDTGTTATVFTTLTWKPTSQTLPATAWFQIATSNDPAGPWNFHGTDGTSGTYFKTSGGSINAADSNARYLRYKIFETAATTSPNWTRIPVITSVGVNYVAGCFTPGQVIFPNLTTGSGYTLTVSMPGYTTKTISSMTVNGGYNALVVSLAP